MNTLRTSLLFRAGCCPLSLARALNLLPPRRAGLWAALGFLGAFAFGLPTARAAVTEAWVHRYSNVVSNSDDRAIKVVRDAAGDIIVIGTTAGGIPQKDMLTVKYSGADGSVLWQQRYNGLANGDDVAKAVAVDGNGNVIVTGYSYTDLGTNDAYTAKYAATDGTLLWEQRHNGLDNYYKALVVVDGSGNVVVTGVSYSPEGHPNAYTAKYAAADGARLWTQHPTNNESYVRAIAVDSSGNVILTSSTNYYGSSYTTKYAAADGMILWQNWFTDSMAEAVAVDSNGNVVVTGYSQTNGDPTAGRTEKYAALDGTLIWGQSFSFSNIYFAATTLAVDRSGDVVVTGTADGSDGYYTVKYAGADGALLWEQQRPGALGGALFYTRVYPTVALDGSGNVLVTGSFYRDTNVFCWIPCNADYYTAKYAAANGELIWEQRYNGPSNGLDHANAIVVDGNGDAIVTGYSGNREADFGFQANFDFYTAKYAATDGMLLWEQRYDGSAVNYAYPNGVAVDSNGNVAVTGVAGRLGGADSYTAKYSAANGALLWERRSNRPANSVDRANAVVVDSSGNLVVTGESLDGTNLVYTAKYAAGDGSLLWERRSNGGGQAMALDRNGNIFVTGGIWIDGTNLDYYTAKYAAANGALLWEYRYDGPAQSWDSASAMALDHDGNVVVTGTSTSWLVTTNGSVLNGDYYTAKYASADGALLWERCYNGPANGSDQASDVAVDSSGNVAITGYSENDYYTAKYAAADGALLWERRYDSPSNGYGHATALAVDSDGNVIVTGYSEYGQPNFLRNAYTAKYAGTDGRVLWEMRYGGSETNYAAAAAIVVDGRGNVVITGSSHTRESDMDYDYFTAKYAAADGALLWEIRYNGPANGNDSVGGLALRSDGTVAITGSSSGDLATIVYREVPSVTIDLVPTGVRLRFTGESGRTYQIERAPAVTGPWSTLATPTAPISGLIEYLDVNPPPGQAFYRTAQP